MANVETVTSLPFKRPPHSVLVTIDPHGPVELPFDDDSDYNERRIDDEPDGLLQLPAMNRHNINEELTFLATITPGPGTTEIVEVIFDFGDGVSVSATPVLNEIVWEAKHTYKVANLGTIAHCTAVDANGDVAHVNVNMLLSPVTV